MFHKTKSQPSPSQKNALRRQLTGSGRHIADERIVEAVLAVPRHIFVPEESQADAYADGPVAIGFGQTISQPYIVAFMTQALCLKPTDRILEIGIGCGYQTTVLSKLATRVYGIEIVEALAARARATLRDLAVDNVQIRTGDGRQGWAEEAPFDAILVACAPVHVPPKLVDQLRPGGRMILPVGRAGQTQDLWLIEKNGDAISRKKILPVRFVPMTGGVPDA